MAQSSQQASWRLYSFLFLLFAFAQPFQLTYSVSYLNRAEELENVDAQIGRMEEGNRGRQIALVALAVWAVIELGKTVSGLQHRRTLLRVLLVAFASWALVSVTWADDVYMTLRRLSILACLTLGAYASAKRLSYGELLLFSFLCGGATLLVGLGFELALGTFRPFDIGYRFGGEMNPIFQAYSCGMMIIAAVALAISARKWRYCYAASAAIAGGFLILSRSRGPLIACASGLVLYWGLVSSRKTKLSLALALGIVALTFFLIVGPDGGAELWQAVLLGRNDSSVQDLTGRVPLWTECLRYFARSPILGYGYGGFWTTSRFAAVSRATDFYIPDTHNGYLDLAVNLGLPGVSLGVMIIARAIIVSIRASVCHPHKDYAFAAGVLVYFAANMWLIAVELEPFVPTFVALVLIMKLATDDDIEVINAPRTMSS